jgi:hypothetical protein
VRAVGPLPLGRRLTRLGALVLASLALAVAVVAATGLAAGGSDVPIWRLESPRHARRSGTFQHPDLTESSGVTASRRQPGILWTLNDSNNGAVIFATDTLGRDHGAFTVTGARNRDWEAIALGPCGRQECLYIGDTGDNAGTRHAVTIYRVPEPLLPSARRATARAEALSLAYPKAPRDVEAMFVGRDGGVYLINKTRGWTARAYRVPASAWGGKRTVTAEELGKMPIEPDDFGDMVTDAAISPSGDVAVRTYGTIYLFRQAESGALLPQGRGCDGSRLHLLGEGISWLDDRVLVLTSEGSFGFPGNIVLLECGGDGPRP